MREFIELVAVTTMPKPPILEVLYSPENGNGQVVFQFELCMN